MRIEITPDEAYDILQVRELMAQNGEGDEATDSNNGMYLYVYGLLRTIDALVVEEARMRSEIADLRRSLKVENNTILRLRREIAALDASERDKATVDYSSNEPKEAT